jgi:hypothetical protein
MKGQLNQNRLKGLRLEVDDGTRSLLWTSCDSTSFLHRIAGVTVSLSLWLYSHLDLGRLSCFLIYTQAVGLLGRGISPSQGRYLHRTTQTQNKRTDIHVLSGIRTHDPSVRASEDGSCFRPRSHCDRLCRSNIDP